MVSPACASGAIAVGAVDKEDGIASYSDGGVELDLVAPGGDMFGGTNYPEIVSTYSTEVANNPYYCLYLIEGTCYDEYLVVDGNRYIDYVMSYNDCCGKHVCGQCLCQRHEGDKPVYYSHKSNDINWCMGTASVIYNSTVAVVVGVATEPENKR